MIVRALIRGRDTETAKLRNEEFDPFMIVGVVPMSGVIDAIVSVRLLRDFAPLGGRILYFCQALV
jgi:hypothetical protein